MKKIITLIFSLTTLSYSLPVQAVVLENPLGTASIPTLIGRVISAGLGITGSLALLMFIYGGFIWMTSGGEKERITKGRKTLTWAVIGLVAIFGAYIAVNTIITAITSGTTA
jgi:hypothetical protein